MECSCTRRGDSCVTVFGSSTQEIYVSPCGAFSTSCDMLCPPTFFSRLVIYFLVACSTWIIYTWHLQNKNHSCEFDAGAECSCTRRGDSCATVFGNSTQTGSIRVSCVEHSTGCDMLRPPLCFETCDLLPCVVNTLTWKMYTSAVF